MCKQALSNSKKCRAIFVFCSKKKAYIYPNTYTKFKKNMHSLGLEAEFCILRYVCMGSAGIVTFFEDKYKQIFKFQLIAAGCVWDEIAAERSWLIEVKIGVLGSEVNNKITIRNSFILFKFLQKKIIWVEYLFDKK